MSTAPALMSGPTSVVSSSPEPRRSFLARASSRSSSGSTTGRSTITREQAVQRWPVVPKALHRIPSVARSRSASLQHDDAVLAAELQRDALEPLGRLASAIDLPVAELPVNEMTPTSGESTIASPTSAPRARDEVDDAGREARLGHQLDEQRRAVRRVAGRLEDDGVAGRRAPASSSSTGWPSGSSRA